MSSGQLCGRCRASLARCRPVPSEAPTHGGHGGTRREVAREMGVDFVETSARTGTNVEEALLSAIRTGNESSTARVSADLGGLSIEDIREFIAFNADDHLPSEGNYSPPLSLSPKSADSFEEGEEGPEAMVLLEEVGEGESVLTLVPMHVCTSEAGLCSFPPRRKKSWTSVGSDSFGST